MTERLYYHDSFLYEFDAQVVEVVSEPRPAIVLDRTAFYPTSGGQVFDTGSIRPDGDHETLPISEVEERDDSAILHFVQGARPVAVGTRVHGLIDKDRRRDHMQQHSGQHVLSAAFVRLFNMPTVSFHMGAEACSIDLDTKTLTSEQVQTAEALANEVATEDRRVGVRFVTQLEAQTLGLRKIPPVERDKLRLVDIDNFDLTACGGTHVASTGQIGAILLRKVEKVRQGWRVEFVCGKRAVAAARADYSTLAEAAGLLSSHIRELPVQIRKWQEDARAARKSGEQMADELAKLYADQALAETQELGGRKIVVRTFPDRDLAFIKALAQRLTRQAPNVVTLLGTSSGQPALIFAQSPGQPFDMGALLKEVLTKLGGRGGGSKDMAQGGPSQAGEMEAELARIAAQLAERQNP